MTRANSCRCSVARRRLDGATGVCATCRLAVHEIDLMHLIKAVLIADPRCIVWRNEVGFTSAPNGYQLKPGAQVRYGVCDPKGGGADLIGMYAGRFLAVETKTVLGRQEPTQIEFERQVITAGGVYALVRSEAAAAELLRHLQSGSEQLPRQLRGGGSQRTQAVPT